MKGQIIIENGSIKEVMTTQVGSSYIAAPIVEVSPPDEEGGVQAEVIASVPENTANASKRIIDIINMNAQAEIDSNNV